MLPVQEYLRSGKTLDDLKNDFAINVCHHPMLPLVGLKYSQIESPKSHPVVRSCRGTVLEKDSWDCVGLTFKRFFNAGEVVEEYRQFNWDDFTCVSKEDGSLIVVYHYAGEWHANTSGSFGLGECQFSGMTWRELFWKTSKIDPTTLVPGYTYIFELCTNYNKVIRAYPQPTTFLLAIFNNCFYEELDDSRVDQIASLLEIPRPEQYRFTSEEEVRKFLQSKEETDITFEGVIIKDDKNTRFKIKTSTYVAMHHLHDNGNIANPKRLIPLILSGERDEVLAYFPEIEPQLIKVESQIEEEWSILLDIWKNYWEIEDQKDFAMSIQGKTAFASLLFTLRRDHGKDQTEDLLREKWRSSVGLITKYICNKHGLFASS